MKYFVYILKSLKDSTFYIGFTSNLGKRLTEHNKGKCKYTKGHIPYKIIHFETFDIKKKAKQQEKYIKSIKNTSRYLKMIGSPES